MSIEEKNPFSSESFYQLLESSDLLTAETGWLPFKVESNDSFTRGYLKSHSYGEYIFDWSWAEFYQRNSLRYYPKMIHAVPFTPVNAPKVVGGDLEGVLSKAKDFYLHSQAISSHHYLFTNDEENRYLQEQGYLLKETLQYHFFNEYSDFDDFLSKLKTRKRKNIKKERALVLSSNLEIRWVDGTKADDSLMSDIFDLYLTTIEKKYSHAYLNLSFFKNLPRYMKEQLKLCMAYENEELVAMSLFIEGEDVLYGRYWGIRPEFQKKHPFLHFELCYYRGMDYCFEHKIPLFEAGAQGEHKLLRGFRPVVITSCHHLRIPEVHKIIEEHLVESNQHNRLVCEDLEQHLPFKKSE